MQVTGLRLRPPAQVPHAEKERGGMSQRDRNFWIAVIATALTFIGTKFKQAVGSTTTTTISAEIQRIVISESAPPDGINGHTPNRLGVATKISRIFE